MSFSFKAKFVQLKGLALLSTDLVDNQEVNLLIKGTLRCIWFQLMNVTDLTLKQQISHAILPLLQKYHKVFEELQGLPPKRS